MLRTSLFAFSLAAAFTAQAQFPLVTLSDGMHVYDLQPGDTTITLARNALTFTFLTRPYTSEKHYAIQLAATANPKNRAYFAEGANSSENPFYSPTGTGIACGEGPYQELYIGESGQHYIYYDLTEEHPRAEISEHLSDDSMLISWYVDKAVYKGKTVSFKKLRAETIYLMILFDANLNGQIDAGEYVRLTANFEK